MEDNIDLNLNAARPDKFYLRFGNIPSIQLLNPKEITLLNEINNYRKDTEYFHLGLMGANIPDFGLNEIKIGGQLAPVATTDMTYEFGNFTTKFKLDNNYIIYKLIYLWILLTKNPEYYNQFQMHPTHEETCVTATLMVQGNMGETVSSFEFYDLRPLKIPSIPLEYTSEGEDLTFDVDWSYTYFAMRKTNGESYDITL